MKTQDRMISLLSRHDFHGEESLEAECSKLGYTFGAGTCFDVMLLKFTNGNTVDDFPDIEGFTVQVDDYISNYGLKELHTNKYDQYLIIFMYGPRMNDELMLHIARKIHQIFADAGEHFLSLGSIRTGVEKAYDSYTSAVILMQGSFFFRRGSLIVPTADEEAARVSDTARYASDFGELLSQRDRDGTLVFLDRILENFRSAARLLLPNQVKDDYYKLFIALETLRGVLTYQRMNQRLYLIILITRTLFISSMKRYVKRQKSILMRCQISRLRTRLSSQYRITSQEITWIRCCQSKQ